MLGKGVQDLVARGEMPDLALDLHRLHDILGELIDGERLVGADVEDLVVGIGQLDGPGDVRGDVGGIAERPRLRAVAEHRQWLAAHQLVHEDPDHIAIPIPDVLVLAVDVVRPEDDVVEPEHVQARAEILLDGELRDPVGVLRLWERGLGHRRLLAPVDRDR